MTADEHVDAAEVTEGAAAPEPEMPSHVMLMMVPLKKLHPNGWNPHRRDPSIQEKLKRGIQETVERGDDMPPLIVRPHPEIEGEYEIIDGEGRYDIAKRLKLEAVPCQIWDVDTPTAIRLTIALNEIRGQRDEDRYWAAIAEFVTAGGTLDTLEYSIPEDPDFVVAGLDLAGMAEAAQFLEEMLDEAAEQKATEAQMDAQAETAAPVVGGEAGDAEPTEGGAAEVSDVQAAGDAGEQPAEGEEGAEDAAAEIAQAVQQAQSRQQMRILLRLYVGEDTHKKLLALCTALGHDMLTEEAFADIVELAMRSMNESTAADETPEDNSEVE